MKQFECVQSARKVVPSPSAIGRWGGTVETVNYLLLIVKQLFFYSLMSTEFEGSVRSSALCTVSVQGTIVLALKKSFSARSEAQSGQAFCRGKRLKSAFSPRNISEYGRLTVARCMSSRARPLKRSVGDGELAMAKFSEVGADSIERQLGWPPFSGDNFVAAVAAFFLRSYST